MNRDKRVDSPWRLRFDIASTLALAWLVNPTGERELKPEVHYYLADRYGRLARELRRRGKTERAARFVKKAEHHYRLSGGDEPPPAVAVAMPIPRAPVVVDASTHPPDGDGDDAA